MARPEYSDDFHRVREAVWLADPLGLAGDRSSAPDEYDDVAWRILSSMRTAGSEEDVQRVWGDQLVALGVLSTPDSAPDIRTLLEEISRNPS